MKKPIKRKKIKRHCPINVNGLLRHYDQGDDRINGKKVELLYRKWKKGEKVNWQKESPTLVMSNES